jgi:hypothetical protein
LSRGSLGHRKVQDLDKLLRVEFILDKASENFQIQEDSPFFKGVHALSQQLM